MADNMEDKEKRLEEEGEMVEVPDEDVEVEDTEDGGAIIRLEQKQDARKHQEHFANIVEDVDQDMLKESVNDLLEKVERDKEQFITLRRDGIVISRIERLSNSISRDG